jgi:lipopolysaccharide transport system ATP-binding protein
VVDEVLAVGDAEFQKKAIGKMQDISNSDGRTVLFVSHDMVAIQNLCSRLIVLGEGKIEYDGDVDLGIRHYLAKKMDSINNYNLIDIKERQGDGTSKFSRIQFSCIYKDTLYENIDKIYSGSSLVYIDLELISYSKVERNVFIAIDMADSMNIPVCNFSNEFTKNLIVLSKGITKVRFEIPNFNFRAQEYKLTLWGADTGNKPFDLLQNEISFSVIETDFFKSGILPRRKQHGYFLMNNSARTIE